MASNQPLDVALEDGSSPSREVGPSPGGTTTKTRLAGVAMIMFGAALVVGPTKIQESAHRRMTQLNSAVGLVLPGAEPLERNDAVGDNKVKLLVFETEDNPSASLVATHAQNLLGIDTTVFGQGSTFNGFSSKYATVRPLLEAMDEDTVVIMSDARDVLVNVHVDSPSSALAAGTIRSHFNALVKDASDGAVVISAEAQCCVAAVTYFAPGAFFDNAGERTARACPSGQPGCMWPEDGDEKRKPWMNFMDTLAELKTGAPQTDAYLNAGLMAGKPKDLLGFFEALKLDETEDDQAVMTDYMFHHPDKIVLDYSQTLFGNNRWPLGMKHGGCIFDFDNSAQAVVHQETGTMPPFVHNPGKFFECNDKLAERLGQHHAERDTTRHLSADNYNYKPVVPAAVVEVPTVVVSSSLELLGISATQFNNPTQKAAFATAIKDTLIIDAVVQNVVATDISHGRRKLLQSGVDVSYDLLVAIPDDPAVSAEDVFHTAVGALTAAVTSSSSTLTDALVADLGVAITVDTTTFVAPATFVEAVTEVPVHSSPDMALAECSYTKCPTDPSDVCYTDASDVCYAPCQTNCGGGPHALNPSF